MRPKTEYFLDALRELGLTDYEARIYLALHDVHPANGNQISQRSGVPSAKVYACLRRLLDRGLVSLIDSRPVTYVPLPADQFLNARAARFRALAATIRRGLRPATSPPWREMLWHLEGYDLLLDRARRIIGEAKRELFLSAWRDQVLDLREGLRQAQRRGVHITAMLFDAPDVEVGFTVHHVMLRTVYERHGDQLLLVADHTAGLMMDRSRGSWSGVWTANPAVLRTIRNYIRHDIYANKLYYRFADLLHATYGPELEFLLDVTADRVLPTAPLPPSVRIDQTAGAGLPARESPAESKGPRRSLGGGGLARIRTGDRDPPGEGGR
ncbi:MAG: helix-turn-helix domain-containing protein [Armatimonadota bacterium]|nr:helix-turn-helix domain-containing protein [Armatimonadota bacterium]MDR7451281.1 helix-turn-helix domain-containing protein [Armatimonadota bacterium]MDR7466816.1 helix-turn-helix domain-containing protein [Armatimonadota bacterium]MDR7492711.1 helix-turn-helix domain-containing protein [Armatimonadota bacterium]MDR7499640.1 helix-turn-helix domain-containing protein [Armatimonadota bacterium]